MLVNRTMAVIERIISREEFEESVEHLKYATTVYDENARLSIEAVVDNVCPVCHSIGNGEIFRATHYQYCTYKLYRLHE